MAFVQDSFSSWKVAAACFLVYFSNFGMVRISGLLFTASLIQYNINRESAAFPIALSTIVRCVSGPLGGYLSYKFGYKFVVMTGCLLSSVGISSCFFTQDIRIIAVLWSIYGLGCGFATSLLPQVINMCFTKHASKANGIAYSGASFAGIFFPLFTVPLLDEYSVPGTYLNLGAIMLHSVLGALVLKTPTSSDDNQVKTVQNHISPQQKTTNDVDKQKCDISFNCDLDTSNKCISPQQKIISGNVDTHECDRSSNCDFDTCNKCTKREQELQNGENTTGISSRADLNETHDKYSTDSEHYNGPVNHVVSTENNSSDVLCRKTLVEICKEDNEIRSVSNETNGFTSRNKLGILNKSDLVKTLEQSKIVLRGPKDTSPNKYPFMEECNEVVKADTTSLGIESQINKTICPSITNRKSDNNNCLQICSVFWDPVYIIIAFVHSFFTCLLVSIPAILVDLSNDKSIPVHQSAYLLVMYSTADLFGKVGLGWITDGHHMSRSQYTALWFSILALAFGMMVWSGGIIVMAIAVCLNGMGIGAITPMIFGVIAEYIGKEKQAMAIASSNIFFVPLSFSMAPLIGYFRDRLGSYNGLLYTLSSASLFCTILLLILPRVRNIIRKSKKLVSEGFF